MTDQLTRTSRPIPATTDDANSKMPFHCTALHSVVATKRKNTEPRLQVLVRTSTSYLLKRISSKLSQFLRDHMPVHSRTYLQQPAANSSITTCVKMGDAPKENEPATRSNNTKHVHYIDIIDNVLLSSRQ